VKEPKLSMALAGPREIVFGKSEIYTLEVSNAGSGDAENVLVLLSTGGRQPATSALGTIAAEQKKRLDVELTGRQIGRLMIHGEVIASGGRRAELNEEILVRQQTAGAEAAAPGLVVTVEDPIDPVPVRSPAAYQVVLRNGARTPAERLEVVVFFDDGFEPVAAEGGRNRISSGQIAFDAIPSLAPGESVAFKIRATASVPGNHLFRVEVSAKGWGTNVVREGTIRFQSTESQPPAVARPAGPASGPEARTADGSGGSRTK
jgi:hypothetical protein